MRLILGALILLLILLQFEFWFSDGGMKTVFQMKKSIAHQQQINAKLDQQNQLLSTQVSDLQNGNAAIEARARNDLGMVKKGEVFYQVVKH